MAEIVGEPELETEPEDLTELLHSHDKALMNEELFIMHEKGKWFL